MDIRKNVKNIFEYLYYLKSLNEKIIRNIKYYKNTFVVDNLLKEKGCTKNNNIEDDWWISIDKECFKEYNFLFDLYQSIEKEEKIEIIFGTGILKWEIEKEDIYHPLFIAKLSLDYNSEDDKFYIKLKDKIQLDIHFLQGINVYDYNNLLKIKENISIEKINPLDYKSIESYFSEILSSLYKKDVNKSNLQEPNIIKNNLIIVRNINTNLWKKDIKDIIHGLDNGMEIPKSIQALATEERLYEDEKTIKEWEDVEKELLFPLPINDEQEEIARKISKEFGVVVQGPPGTGKSHTIANLICHLLAHGKRVLVTSEKGKALKVLLDKIPEEIKALCVNLNGNDTKSIKNLEESVRQIVDNLALNPRILSEELTKLKDKLELCRLNQNKYFERLIDINRKENMNINYCGETFKINDIAIWLRENEKDFSWIEDDIDLSNKAPISQKEFERLIEYRRTIKKEELAKIKDIGILLDKIPSYKELSYAIKKFLDLKNRYEYNLDKVDGWNIYSDEGFQYNKVKEVIWEGMELIDDLEKLKLIKVMKDYFNSDILKASISSMLLNWRRYSNRLSVIKKELNSHNISIPKDVNLYKFEKDFDKIYEEINKKNKLRKSFLFLNKDCSYIINECLVDCKPIDSIEPAIIIKLYFEQNNIEKSMISLWNNTMNMYKELFIEESNVNSIIIIENYIKNIQGIVHWDERIRMSINKYLGNIKYPRNLKWTEKSTLIYLEECIDSIEEINQYNQAKTYLNTMTTFLSQKQEFYDIVNAIEELDICKLKNSYEYLEDLKVLKRKIEEMNIISNKLKIVCPKTYNKIEKGDCQYFKNWNRAWRWRKWDCLLNKIKEVDEDKIEELLEYEKNREREIIKNIIYKKTWYNQIMKVSEDEKRSLMSWLNAVKRIGKGKGKYTDEYVKLAQQEMEKCKNIIPIWIMPVDNVIENINVLDRKFDVVICDESSQSNIFSLCALMRGKKAIIVGDEQQISPQAVGINFEQVKNLGNIYLKNIPHKEWFDLQTSLYDTALRVFPDRIILKEHFRSLPEIIGFSNKLCYFNEIKILRHAKRSERLLTPIKTVKVNNGKRDEKKSINKEEAMCIANKIYECCNDKRYNGMTMGVISLLGECQGEYIQELLKEKIGIQEMIKRKIICGDAYSFQGDERDIIFLSMVIGNNMKFASLTKEADIKRFNVAASRAKNQMWVFHSVDLKDLNKDCVRYELLEYCNNYKKYNDNNNKLEYMEKRALHKEIYNIINSKGYEIYPSSDVYGIKSDFIVEGRNNKVFIKCKVHGSEKRTSEEIRDEYKLELKLKNMGWNIIKIRDLDYHRNPEKTMLDFFLKLSSLDILPNKNNIKEKILIKNKGLKAV
ncbi:AAA family ATPase [Clostridium cochlearium]|uniref:AAA domain-containing protein n=1 Tax=Clostridium cochlearium TaxID=1494 RepID=UPI001459EA9B|nr:AAA domain-containing protein [Clostridium cochlearium]NME96258.1 AAA family ATPase [Clostridium cochlearium]